jgi:hypothetical protein
VGQPPFEPALKQYNKDSELAVVRDGEILEKNDSIQALIIVINDGIINNAKQSISNNLHLQEVQIYNGNQDLLDYIASLKLPNLKHLFYNNFEYQSLNIPQFPTLELLKIQSQKLESLNMTNSQLDKLEILDIDTPNLTVWKTDKNFPKLGLINLNATKLDFFPIEQMPQIRQFSYYCSFEALPLNLCSYTNLKFISFNNYGQVKIDKCFKQKIKAAIYSNITIYDKELGKPIREILSDDRR